MRSYIALAVFGLVVTTSSLSAQQNALQTAATALRVSQIKTLQVPGSGANPVAELEKAAASPATN